MKKVEYNPVAGGFANDQKKRLKGLDLNVNFIYKGE
jgi:hypothetical protein